MSWKLIRNGALSLLLAGLCAAAAANTTTVRVPLHFISNDITIHPEIIIEAESMGSNTEEAAVPMAVPEPFREVRPSYELPPLPAARGSMRMALLLPLHSDALRETAEAVRAGFAAAQQADRDANVSVTLVQTGDNPNDILSAYSAALPNHEIIVGPMTRSGVTAVANSGFVSKPTIALAQAEDRTMLPPMMLPMGMSLEEESRQIARWAAGDARASRAFVLATHVAWQRRAARAFMQEWHSLGGNAPLVELNMAGAYLDPNNLVKLRQRVKDEQPSVIFVALDAAQARQVREAIGTETPIYGTSQVNPLPYQQGEELEQVPFMDGIRLVDMPWQLQPDHAAVMVYPRVAPVPGQRRSANLERFYAIGIDAYRVAKEIGRGNILFEMDGVTGKLRVSFGGRSPFLQRIATPAFYREGIVVPAAAR